MSRDYVTLNMNLPVFVRLTDEGRQYLRDEYGRFWEQARADGRVRPGYTPPDYVEPREDADGHTQFQLWDFMEKFGPICGVGTDPSRYFKDGNDLIFDSQHLKPLEGKK